MLTVSINLAVPPVTDNDVWWANAAAWTNYWANIDLTGTFDPYNNDTYTETPYDNTQQGYQINYGDQPLNFPSTAQFNSLLAAYQALNASYKQLRQDLINIGLIENV